MASEHTHPTDCPDRKAAAADRKQREASRMAEQKRLQAIAHAEWLDWYPASTGT
jgi:hypothetical protein